MRQSGFSPLLCGTVLPALIAGGTLADWTIVASYPIPEGASGLAWDGTHLYCGIYGADGQQVHRIDPENGDVTLLFDGDHDDAFGLTFDGTYLWTTDHAGSSSTPAQALRLDWNGNILESIDLPDHYMSGIAWDSGDFWVARYYEDPGHVYRINSDGGVEHEFDAPDDQPWDIAVGDGVLWIADYWGDVVHAVDPNTGAVLDTYPTTGVDPAGVVWDGDYLWVCDNGDGWVTDRLYKIDLAGAGAPEILIGSDSHVFPFVIVGELATWDLSVANVGDAPLTIQSVEFEASQGDSSTLSIGTLLPMTIPVGQARTLPIGWSPAQFGQLAATATIVSDDPVHPQTPVTIEGFAYEPSPTIAFGATEHAFGAVRVGASTRWLVPVTNQGAEPLVIDAAMSSSDRISVHDLLPLSIEPGAVGHLGIWFLPEEEALVNATVEVSSNAVNEPTSVLSVSGSGIIAELPLGNRLWSWQVPEDWDQSLKAMTAIEDVSGDGRTEVIVCSEDAVVRCLNGNAHGTGDALWAHDVGNGSVYSNKGLNVVSDLDGDGVQDVVFGATGGARLVRALSGISGEVIWTYNTNLVGDGGWVYQVDGRRDYNGDGVVDVLACAGDDGSDTGPNRAYCISGDSGMLIWQRPLGGPVFSITGVADVNGDGLDDVVAGASNADETEGRAVAIDGLTGAILWSFPVDGGSVWGLAPIGDVTGDGIDDVMIGDFWTGDVYGIDASNGTEAYWRAGTGLLAGLQSIGDVNGDGHPDVIPEHYDNDARVYSGRTGELIWSSPTIDAASVASAIPDITGDGVEDVVVGTLFTDNALYVLDGTQGAVLHTELMPSPVDAVAVIPDVTGDGSWEVLTGLRNGLMHCDSGGLDAAAQNPADIDGDGVVGVNDILLVIGAWGQQGGVEDIDGDGLVGVSDLLMVLDSWTF